MSQPCKNCDKAATLFLCTHCTDTLRDNLYGLARGRKRHDYYEPGWLDFLEDSALGKTRLGESARRSPRYRQRLDGDKSIASQIELLPCNEQFDVVEGPARDSEPWPVKVLADIDHDLAKARRDRARAALRHALGSGRINLRASELMDEANTVLVLWVRDICETNGVAVPQLRNPSAMALWLARNVSAIASDEGAASCYRDIEEMVRDIEKTINRREALYYCGTCPAVSDGEPCGTALEALHNANEVQCWKCKTVHDVNDLIDEALDSDLLYSANEVREVMAHLGQPISDRTWRYWRAEGRLETRGWRGAEPMYWIKDARELMAAKPQKVATGGAAARRAG